MPVWLACQRSGAGAKTEPREPGPLHSGGGKLVDRPRGVAGQTVPAMGPVPSRTTLCVGPRPSARPCCEAAPPLQGQPGPRWDRGLPSRLSSGTCWASHNVLVSAAVFTDVPEPRCESSATRSHACEPASELR